MWHMTSDNQLWTETKTFVAALASATMFTTHEKARLSAIHAKFATSAAFVADATKWRQSDAQVVIGAVKKLFTRKHGSND